MAKGNVSKDLKECETVPVYKQKRLIPTSNKSFGKGVRPEA